MTPADQYSRQPLRSRAEEIFNFAFGFDPKHLRGVCHIGFKSLYRAQSIKAKANLLLNFAILGQELPGCLLRIKRSVPRAGHSQLRAGLCAQHRTWDWEIRGLKETGPARGSDGKLPRSQEKGLSMLKMG